VKTGQADPAMISQAMGRPSYLRKPSKKGMANFKAYFIEEEGVKSTKT
jgi:hypothetical protein